MRTIADLDSRKLARVVSLAILVLVSSCAQDEASGDLGKTGAAESTTESPTSSPGAGPSSPTTPTSSGPEGWPSRSPGEPDAGEETSPGGGSATSPVVMAPTQTAPTYTPPLITDCSSCEPDQICLRSDCEGHGVCFDEAEYAAIGPDCFLDENPVCGCDGVTDGVTYGNSCALLRVNVGMAFQWPCDFVPVECDCAEGETCIIKGCDEEQHGECAPWPTNECQEQRGLWCLCDGTITRNACPYRAPRGLGIRHEGACEMDANEN